MPTDLGPAWVAFAGGAFGAIAGALTTRLTLRSAGDLAASQRTHERMLAVEDRAAAIAGARASYQVETLLELQMAIQRMMRSHGRIGHHDAMAHRSNPESRFGSTLLEEGWSFASMEAVTAVRILSERVDSDAVRIGCDLLIKELGGVTMAQSEVQSKMALAQAGLLCQDLLAHVGELLRNLPAPTVYRPIITSPMVEYDRPEQGTGSG